MRIRFRLATILTLLPQVVLGQEPATFRAGTDLVTIPVTVTNRHGLALKDLKREDFRVFDNGVQTDIQNLWRDSDLSLTVGVIVDISYSEHSKIPEQRQAVAAFLDRIMRPGDRAFLATTASSNVLVTDLTSSVEELRKGTERIQPERYRGFSVGQPLGEPCPTKVVGKRVVSRCGGSAIWDSVYAAAKLELRPVEGTKALIILSDGQDTGSMHNLERTVEEVQASNVVVYALKVGDLRTMLTHGLSKLAVETGGEQFKPTSKNLAQIFQQIETDLRTRYVLGFHPDRSTAREGLHQLRVEILKPGANVRARTGYYQLAGKN